MANAGLHNRVSIRRRFLRSINLREDLSVEDSIRSYIVTPDVREHVEMIVRSLMNAQGPRAWSVTGPYGAGKSAFALFLTDVLCSERGLHSDTRDICTSTMWQGRLLPVVVIGHRGSLMEAIVSALAESIASLDPSAATHIRDAGQSTTADRVWDLFESAIHSVKNRGYNGLFVVVDELGKFLEHAVTHPGSTDLIVLQYLAEEADRHPGEFLFVTILHSAFADYLPTANRVMRAEWQKIQGRFRDLVFSTSLNHHLTLLSMALDAQFEPDLRHSYDAVVDELLADSQMRYLKGREVYRDLLRKCAPIHPVAALLTWPIFRSKMAQNERSLFSFLASHEYKGFAWFLDRQSWERGQPVAFYRLNDLYDYVVNALGSAVSFGEFSTGWAEIADTLDRVDASAPELTKEVVKVVGLLSLYGWAVGLDATPNIVRIALGNAPAVDEALAYLERSQLVIFRRYSGAYRLWEGSDVDLDEEFERAKHQISDRSLAQRLTSIIDLRPVVARKHYIERGTLRTFEVCVIDGSEHALKAVIESGPSSQADGLIVYALSSSEADRLLLVRLACDLTSQLTEQHAPIVIAFPEQVAGLEAVLQELEVWLWIRNNDTRVAGDRAARKELDARIDHFRQRVDSLVGGLFALNGYRHEPQASTWVYRGNVLTFRSGKHFSKWLSDLCDEVYHACPVIPNELINRRHLSSAAVAARRNLMQAMIEKEYEPNLGLTGGAAETTMYHAILAKSGLHKNNGDTGYFDAPNEEWMPVWRAIEQFLSETVTEPKCVTELYQRLAAPPLGIRPGVVPVLLLAFMIRKRHEVALYEDDVYVPGIRIEVMERLTRQPDRFKLRSFKLNPERTALLEQVAMLPRFRVDAARRDHHDHLLLMVVEPLVRFVAGLTPYAKSTKRFNDACIPDLRLAIQKASDPYKLIFEELPKICGTDLNSADGRKSYVERLGNAIIELENAYPNLLAEIEREVYLAFGLESTGSDGLERLRKEAEGVKPWASEPQLKRLVMELTRATAVDWREGIGRVVMDGLSPSHWTDSHVPQFRARLHLLAGDFLRLRELAREHAVAPGSPVVRISVLDGAFKEVRVTTTVPPDLEEPLKALVGEIQALLHRNLVAAGCDSEALRRAVLARALMNEIRGERGE